MFIYMYIYNNKKYSAMANILENWLLHKYPWSTEITYERRVELLGNAFNNY